MCTLIALHRQVAGAPLVVAANRDEFFDRPAEGPALRRVEGGTALAPRDLRAGGTWLGLGERGVFAAVTNRRCPQPDAARRSRGLLALDAMARPSARAAADMLAALPERAYNPFNCLVADTRECFALVYEDRPRLQRLAPGAYVVGNVDPDTSDHPKVCRVRERARRAARLPRGKVLAELAAICREHLSGGRTLDDTCVHLDGYGTRSSALLLLADPAPASRFLFADGPPCSVEYRDFTSLLHELNPRAGYEAGEAPARKAS
jgi:uncharacterized protein with NRDE domain